MNTGDSYQMSLLDALPFKDGTHTSQTEMEFVLHK